MSKQAERNDNPENRISLVSNRSNDDRLVGFPNQSLNSSLVDVLSQDDQSSDQLNVMMNDEASRPEATESSNSLNRESAHYRRTSHHDSEMKSSLKARNHQANQAITTTTDGVKWFTEVVRIRPSNFLTDRHHHPKVGLLSASIFRTNASRLNHSYEGILPTYNGILSPGTYTF